MGGRLSVPKGPDGTTELSNPKKSPYPRGRAPVNSRTLVAPAAAFTMACLLFVYTRVSIRAAKSNAQRHRDSDSGGEGLDLLKESRRRHGHDKLDEGGTLRGLAEGAREQFLGSKSSSKDTEKLNGRSPISENEERLKAAMKKNDGRGI